MQNPLPANNRISPLVWLGIALPVVIHIALLFLYAVNAPRLDDFSELLTFLPDWHAAASMDDKLGVLFRDYQNHRYVLYHALLIATNGIDFRIATIIGNIPLLLLCGLMTLALGNHAQKKALLLMAVLLVFNLQSWRAMFWGPLGTTNLLYPAVGLFACWLATRGTRGVIAAGVTAIFLTLAHGSGPLLFPVITVYLFVQHQQKHVSLTVLTGWLTLSAATFLLYFVIFPLNSDAGYASQPTTLLLGNLFAHSWLVVRGFFAVIGSTLLFYDPQQHWRETLAIALGASECAALGWLIYRGSLRQQPALVLWLGFLLLTTASIAAGRVSFMGLDQAMQGHYKLLNGLLLWVLIAAVLDAISQHQPAFLQPALLQPALLQHASTAAVALCVTLYATALLLCISPMQTFQQALDDDIRQWQTSGKLDNIETRLFVKQPNRKLKAAIDGGFYTPDNQTQENP